MKPVKLPQGMSPESVSVKAEDYKFGNEKKAGVELRIEKIEFTRHL